MLTELDARLGSKDRPWPRTEVLCGFGGAGKTSVALAYAHQYKDELGVAWQFAADDATVLAAGFGELAAQLGVIDIADARDPVASVHAALAASRPGGCSSSTTRLTGRRSRRSCRPPGMGGY